MIDMVSLLKHWQVDERAVRERMYRAPNPRERERWHVLWLLARGWSASQAAAAHIQRQAAPGPTQGLSIVGNWRHPGPSHQVANPTPGSRRAGQWHVLARRDFGT